jgi:hypothetical protein
VRARRTRQFTTAASVAQAVVIDDQIVRPMSAHADA